MLRFIFRSCIVILCFNFYIFSIAEDVEYKFRHLTTEDGLSSNHINTIFKDSKGFMWFGTDEGLDRYDGYSVKSFRCYPADSSTLSGNDVIAISEMDNGKLLIGTSLNGLNLLDVATEKFTRFRNLPGLSEYLGSSKINTIVKDSNDIFWIGTNTGLIKYQASTGSIDQFLPDTLDKNNESNNINAIFKESADKYWLGTNNGLFHCYPKSEICTEIPLISKGSDSKKWEKIINCIYKDSEGTIWIGTHWWLYAFSEGNQSWIGSPGFYTDQYTPNNLNILSITEQDSYGKHYLWMVSWGGLDRYDYESKTFLSFLTDPLNPEAIRSYYLTSLCSDESGLLWIGTKKSGIEIVNIQRNIFERHLTRHFSSASSFLVDPLENIWVGISDDGLMKMDSNMNPVSFYKFRLPGEETQGTCRIYNFFLDSDNDIWIGDNQLMNQGLFIFNREKEWFEPVSSDYLLKCTTPRSGEPFFVNAILEDSKGNFWFGTDHGLYTSTKENKRFLNYHPLKVSDTIFHLNIWDLWIDTHQGLWIATENYGLLYLHDLASNRKTNDELNSNNIKQFPFEGKIYDIYTDKNDKSWLATSSGLFKIDLKDTSMIPAADSGELIMNIQIYNIGGDTAGYLWINSNEGLIRYDPSETCVVQLKKYTISDGLPFDQYQDRSFYQAPDGRIFLGGIWGTADGFLVFNPNNIKDNKNIPEIAVTDFKVEQKPFKLDSAISSIRHIFLDYDQNFFSFEFAVLDYVNPELNQYAYYLEGLEDDWIEAGNRRFANYTGVSPGTYTFKVKGSNNDGYWNKNGTSLEITILPPPWRTWWAYTLYGLAITALLWGWRKYDLRRQSLKQALEVEHLEREKLKELDSMKSRFFANISHEFRTPLTLILGPLEKMKESASHEIKNDLVMVQRNARRLQKLINQLLDLSKIESAKMKLQAHEVNLVKTVKGIVQSFESLAEQKKINLEFKSEKDVIPAYADLDKLEKILANLLSNAFKFTADGGSIIINMALKQSPQSKGDGGVLIQISDSGTGIAPDKLPRIFDRFYQEDGPYAGDQKGTGIGLALTKELVELHHGTIRVESMPGKGTTFTITLPLGSDYLHNEEIVSHSTQAVRHENIDHQDKITHDQMDIASALPTEEAINEAQANAEPDKPIILIVEDNQDLRDYIRNFLDQTYSVIEAVDGKSGFNTAIEQIPNLIISDVMMPEMDGFELCEKLKTDERTSHIPLILLTARAGQESKLEGLELGADDYITKPFESKELIARIKNLLETRRKLREYFQMQFRRSGLESMISFNDIGITSMEQKFLQKTVDIVQENLSDPDFTVKKLCSEMAMSNMQFHRKLVAITGETAKRFIRTCRLKRAATLLENRTGNVTEIAYEVGFNNLSWFAKCFQEQFGISPSEFFTNKGSL